MSCRGVTIRAGPQRVVVNGWDLNFEREPDPYREGGAALRDQALDAALDRPRNVLEIEM